MAEQLEHRIARLEATREIEQLMIRYADICDRGYDPAEISTILTEDAVWDGGSNLGRHEGRSAICDFFGGASERITWALHYMIAAAVEVDEDLTNARGSWYLWQPCTIETESGPRACLIAGRYANRLRRENGQWLFSEITIKVETETPLDEGWVKTRFLP
jgi:hypothetical protein